MTKVWIEKDPNEKGLWLIVKGKVETAFPIRDNEVEAISLACEVWLEEQSQESMRKSIERS